MRLRSKPRLLGRSLQEHSMTTAHPTRSPDLPECWPAFRLTDWKDTYATLHMWTQIVGKIRLELTPRVNHWWNVPLYVSSRGLSTSIIPYGNRHFDMEFDFVESKLIIRTTDPKTASVALAPRSVADFYHEVMSTLRGLGIEVKIWKMPVEVADAIPFDEDKVHASYDAEYVRRLWRILLSVDEVFQVFRSRFVGKSSPVHFFWGSFDLAVTRFSGRRAPERPGADPITREAYSHEVISCGFWPGGGDIKEATYYAYAAPEPEGFAQRGVKPAEAYYDTLMKEFLLPYEAVRIASSPRDALLAFARTT